MRGLFMSPSPTNLSTPIGGVASDAQLIAAWSHVTTEGLRAASIAPRPPGVTHEQHCRALFIRRRALELRLDQTLSERKKV